MKVLHGFCILALLALINNSNGSQLINRGNYQFPELHLDTENYLNEPCSPLNDVWGFDTEDSSYAVVGASNGVAIVDVSNRTAGFSVVSFPYVGCITEWRDMKTYQNYLYVVNDYTTLCDCSEEQQPCQQQLVIEYLEEEQEFRAAGGHAQKPLSDFPDGVSGLLVIPMSDTYACSPLTEDLTGKIAFVDRGNCSFTEKTLIVQQANASGIVIASDSQDTIYPSMSGNNTGIEIPGLLIGSTDADTIKSLMGDGINVTAVLDSTNRRNSSLYSGPDGWYILDITDPENVLVANQTNEFFDYAHNILVDPLDRPLAYVCGQSSNSFNSTGGVIVFDLSDPVAPQLIAEFSTSYIHDIEVELREDGDIVLYGCAIYDGLFYVLNVTDPWNNPDLNNEVISVTTTISWPHNSAQTEDGAFLYITHEEFAYPVTVYDSRDLTNLTYVSEFSVNAEEGTSPHNVMVDGTQLWMSYYSEGVLVYDISEDPTSPQQIGQFDTSDYENGFHGVWGIFPYTREENVVYASDIESGLWVLELVGDPTPSNSPIPVPSSAPSGIPSPTPNPLPSASANTTSTYEESTYDETSTTGINTNTTTTDGDGDGDGSDDNTLLWITVSVGVVAAILIIFVIAAGVAFFIIRKRVTKQSSNDDFDGRIDEDDLF